MNALDMSVNGRKYVYDPQIARKFVQTKAVITMGTYLIYFFLCVSLLNDLVIHLSGITLWAVSMLVHK